MIDENYGVVLFGNGVDYNVSYKGSEILARLRGRLLHITKRSHHPVCAGDHVKLIEAKESYFIDAILPRRNKISRPSNYQIRKEQTIVANIDNLFVIASVNAPPLNSGFIDRLLVFSDMQNIDTTIVINKTDLGVSKSERNIIDSYRKMGFKIIETSVEKDLNINKVRELTKNSISAFIGNSGVGKSSILNKIDKTIMQKVGKVSDYSSKGKHTTKQARLFTLETGGYIIDTPGIREFGLWMIDYEDLKDYFPEMRALANDCKYSNCKHDHEPECAVKDAVASGSIPRFRYENYLKIFESLKENKDIYFKKD